jgi:hypothetical protein
VNLAIGYAQTPSVSRGLDLLGYTLGDCLGLLPFFYSFVSPGPLPGVQYAAWFSTWASFPIWFLAATMLYLLFPDGRLPSPRVLWRPLAWTAVISGAINALGEALASDTNHASIANPLAVGGAVGRFLGMAAGFGSALLVLSCVASMASPVVRLRRARGRERQQLKWFVYATALTVVCFVLATAWPSTPQAGSLAWKLTEVAWNLMTLGFLVMPLTTAIAILKHRLYDIDRIINRTLVYVALTAILAGVYVAGVAASQGFVRALTGQEQSQLAIVAFTLVIAALFSPLRRSIQSFIDRHFYRRRYDAGKTLEAFSVTLRDETDLDALNDDLVGVVRKTMRPTHVSLWLRPDTASKGNPAD